MKNRIRSALSSELRGVRVREPLKARILAEASATQFRETKRSPLAPLAAAAAIILVAGLAIALLTLRTAQPDRRSTVFSDGYGDWAWVCDADALYHARQNCGGIVGAQRMLLSDAKSQGRTVCPVCIQVRREAATAAPTTTQVPAYTAEPVYETFTSEQAFEDESADYVDYSLLYTPTPEPNPTAAALTYAPTSEQNPTADAPAYTSTPEPEMDVIVDPPAQADDSGSNAASDTEAYVGQTFYSSLYELYYHADPYCSMMDTTLLLTESAAQSLGLEPCPNCLAVSDMAVSAVGGTIYWAKRDTPFYHKEENCPNADDTPGARAYEADMQQSGYLPCPVCFSDRFAAVRSTALPEGASISADFIASSGDIYVWMADGGTFYHSYDACPCAPALIQLSLRDALAEGAIACPSCRNLSSPEVSVWMDESNVSHRSPDCAHAGTLIEATASIADVHAAAACPYCADDIAAVSIKTVKADEWVMIELTDTSTLVKSFESMNISNTSDLIEAVYAQSPDILTLAECDVLADGIGSIASATRTYASLESVAYIDSSGMTIEPSESYAFGPDGEGARGIILARFDKNSLPTQAQVSLALTAVEFTFNEDGTLSVLGSSAGSHAMSVSIYEDGEVCPMSSEATITCPTNADAVPDSSPLSVDLLTLSSHGFAVARLDVGTPSVRRMLYEKEMRSSFIAMGCGDFDDVYPTYGCESGNASDDALHVAWRIGGDVDFRAAAIEFCGTFGSYRYCAAELVGDGRYFWSTYGGLSFHSSSNCRDMRNASVRSLGENLALGKTPCSTCLPGARCLDGASQEYHADFGCERLSAPERCTSDLAGYTPCPACTP